MLQELPYYVPSADLFSLADLGYYKLHVSSLTFANVNYILCRKLAQSQARKMLIKFKALVTVVPVNDKIIQLSLASDFDDFEDAIQYHAAIENGLNTLITRNLKDYTKAKIKVLSAQQFLRAMI